MYSNIWILLSNLFKDRIDMLLNSFNFLAQMYKITYWGFFQAWFVPLIWTKLRTEAYIIRFHETEQVFLNEF